MSSWNRRKFPRNDEEYIPPDEVDNLTEEERDIVMFLTEEGVHGARQLVCESGLSPEAIAKIWDTKARMPDVSNPAGYMAQCLRLAKMDRWKELPEF